MVASSQLSLVANLTCDYLTSLHISQKSDGLLSSQLSLVVVANLACEYLTSLQSLTNSKSCFFLSFHVNIRLVYYISKLWQLDFSSIVSGGQSDLSLIPQSLCQSKFHQLMPKISGKY